MTPTGASNPQSHVNAQGPVFGTHRPGDAGYWMLDTDQDGESFFAWRIYFPEADKDAQIKKLLSRLGRRADEVEALTAVRSAPFDPPERGRVAVKVITRTGMEMTSVVEIADGLCLLHP